MLNLEKLATVRQLMDELSKLDPKSRCYVTEEGNWIDSSWTLHVLNTDGTKCTVTCGNK